MRLWSRASEGTCSVIDRNANLHLVRPLCSTNLSPNVLSRRKKHTERICGVQPQCIQGFGTRMQKRPRTLHREELHVAKAESAKKSNHVRHKLVSSDRRECQPPSQRRYGEGNKCCVVRVLLLAPAKGVNELEIFQVWEKSDEI